MKRPPYLESTAAFSDCGRYRFSLSRRLSMGARSVLFVGLNPSTATATADDPTIRRCIGYARQWGFDVYLMGNIMAFRSTDPKRLPADSVAAVGPRNREALIALAARAELIVCAWGANKLGPAASDIAAMVMAYPQARCLGTNKDGTPKHPLYLRRSLVPVALRQASQRPRAGLQRTAAKAFGARMPGIAIASPQDGGDTPMAKKASKGTKKKAVKGSKATAAKGTKRKAAKRELLDTKSDKRYVRRGQAGKFKESDDVSKSLSADNRKKAKTKAKRGQGDKGDR